jgi:GNAT superfamily N-acetyltransferase
VTVIWLTLIVSSGTATREFERNVGHRCHSIKLAGTDAVGTHKFIRSVPPDECPMLPPVRIATPADISELKRIRQSVRENVLNPARVSDRHYGWFVRNGPVWVWEDDGDLRGFSAGDPRDGSVWALFVHPIWEGRGIGTALLARACASLFAAGHLTATLHTEPFTRAADFYRHRGWTEGGLNSAGEVLFSRSLSIVEGD